MMTSDYIITTSMTHKVVILASKAVNICNTTVEDISLTQYQLNSL